MAVSIIWLHRRGQRETNWVQPRMDVFPSLDCLNNSIINIGVDTYCSSGTRQTALAKAVGHDYNHIIFDDMLQNIAFGDIPEAIAVKLHSRFPLIVLAIIRLP